VLSHDVDDVAHASFRDVWRLLRQSSGPRSYALRAGLTGLRRSLARRPGRSDPYWTFDRWMAEEERRGFRSSWYFCPPEPARRHEYDALYHTRDRLRFEGRTITVAELMRVTRGRGHEVGLHGSYLSPDDGDELGRQRDQIARASGAEPAGIRQHFLRFGIGTTWRAQRRAGFAYDSTLGYNEAVGFRAGVAAPFRPWDPESGVPHDVWELPLTLMDGTLFRTLKLDGARASDRVRLHLDEVERVGGLAVLLWHPNSADRGLFPGWWDCYLATLDELQRRRAWIAPAAELLEWWRSRRLSSPSRSGLC
jgi:peptidoglycan/xylan/chitin deacetylase (PgdA/CDA1 family)